MRVSACTHKLAAAAHSGAAAAHSGAAAKQYETGITACGHMVAHLLVHWRYEAGYDQVLQLDLLSQRAVVLKQVLALCLELSRQVLSVVTQGGGGENVIC